ncbi:MAG: hypothetical protein HC828_10235 [Blastochloris sp.]|nr:hypothetical protein [Blastochloris sp.]
MTTELRDFLYLDSTKLYSFVSQIQGGLISEVSEKIKQLGGLSAGINVGVAPLSGKIDASKNKENERQQTIQITDPVYFDVIYRHLMQINGIVDITNSSLSTRETLDIGQFVEMRGEAEPPVVETWIERLENMFSFFAKNAKTLGAMPLSSSQGNSQKKGRAAPVISDQQIKQFKTITDLLVDYITVSRQDPGKQYVRIAAEKQEYAAWCGLIPDFIVTPLQATLPADIKIFGRVERLVKQTGSWRIVDLGNFNQKDNTDKLLNALNAFNVLFRGKNLSENDFEVKHPDIIITPIAIYR